MVSPSARLSRISSIIALIGAVNIFYGLYRFMMRDIFTGAILIVTYLVMMYSAAVVDGVAEKLRRIRETP